MLTEHANVISANLFCLIHLFDELDWQLFCTFAEFIVKIKFVFILRSRFAKAQIELHLDVFVYDAKFRLDHARHRLDIFRGKR